MQHHQLKDMIKGWFVGHFDPCVFRSSEVEVAVKNYKAGDREPRHLHKIATEITVIIQGTAAFSGKEFASGDIVTLSPHEACDFHAITDVTTVVVKLPSVPDDKYVE